MVTLGCIADDLTGASDLADALVHASMPTVLSVGVPKSSDLMPSAAAVVIALKSRTIEPSTAVKQSRDALRLLRAMGAGKIYFKYCSTFDSTDKGNIGPVADALLDDLGSSFTVACPAFPANGRTVYQGHLFVGSELLSKSGMRRHPLTPMRESNLVQVLSRQVSGKVGLLGHDVVRRGKAAILRQIRSMESHGYRYTIVDAIEDRNLKNIASACAELPLATGGSALGGMLAECIRKPIEPGAPVPPDVPAVGGHSAVIAGSCSLATLDQIRQFSKTNASIKIDALQISSRRDIIRQVAERAISCLSEGPVLVYSSASPRELAHIHGAIGPEQAGKLVENALAEIAKELVGAGVRRLVVAGGETSGVVIKRLGIRVLQIGPRIVPGVPWTVTVGDRRLLIAMKSGNFGGRDFFQKALRMVK